MTARISILVPILLAFILAPTVAARAAKPPSPGHSSVTGKAVADTSARKHVEGHDGIFLSWGRRSACRGRAPAPRGPATTRWRPIRST